MYFMRFMFFCVCVCVLFSASSEYVCAAASWRNKSIMIILRFSYFQSEARFRVLFETTRLQKFRFSVAPSKTTISLSE